MFLLLLLFVQMLLILQTMAMMVNHRNRLIVCAVVVFLLSMDGDQVEDDLMYFLLSIRDYPSRRRSCRWNGRSEVPRMDDRQFKSHFRLKLQTFKILAESLEASWDRIAVRRKKLDRINVQLALMIFLWRISNTVTYREIGFSFGVSKSTALKVCRRISSLLIHHHHRLITLPHSSTMWRAQAVAWSAKTTFPGVVGAIDGCHIPLVVAPTDYAVEYFNRKQFYSIVLQAVVNSDQLFMHVTVGMPGSHHDSSVLRYSPIWQSVPQTIPIGHFIIGDSAYPIQPWLLTPYKRLVELDQHHRAFNKALSQARVYVEIVGLILLTFSF